MWKFQESIKKEVKFLGVIKKKSCRIFKECHTISQNFQRSKAVFSGISKGKVTSGLELEKFKVLYKHWNPRENLEKIEYYEPDQDKEENKLDVLSSSKFLS